jgi:hypothetical protein
VFLIPIRCVTFVLLAASLIHCTNFSSSFILARTKLADFSAVTTELHWLHTRDITTAPTTQKTSSSPLLTRVY